MTIHECPHCGVVLTKSRSLPDHNRFHAIIDAAYSQWPERCEFQPDSKDQLRSWLTCKAGYRESTVIEMPEGSTPAMQTMFRLSIENAIRAANGAAFVVPYKSGVAVVRAKSIAWMKMGQREFNQLRSAVEDVIRLETGLDPEALLREKVA